MLPDWLPCGKPSPISSNTLFQTIAVAVLVAHAGVLVGVWQSSRGPVFLLLLNAMVALAILLYAASRARYIWASADWPYVGLIVFELIVMVLAFLAYRESRVALLSSYVAFGLHACVSLAAVVFAFTFKITRLI